MGSSSVLVALLFLGFLGSAISASPYTKYVLVTNNHTNYLSVRCFSFGKDYDVKHLASGQRYQFKVHVEKIFPSSTMFNCSTNMGTFVAFHYNYECNKYSRFNTCEWRYDEDRSYRWEPKKRVWVAVEYNPNYESLARGGVVRGYFAN